MKMLREKITLDYEYNSGVNIPVIPDDESGQLAARQNPKALFHLNEEVIVVNAEEFAALIEQLRHACSIALGDLIGHGMPPDVSTRRLLQAAIVAAVEYLAQAEAEKVIAALSSSSSSGTP
jgi:hypothetical protein